jgi:hypothetical protein
VTASGTGKGLRTRKGVASRSTRTRTQARNHSGWQATAASAPTSTRLSQSGKRKLPMMMPQNLKLARELQAISARFTHPGRNRLIRSLKLRPTSKLFGWLDRLGYQLPLELEIPCAACHVAKARKRANTGTERRAAYDGQIWHTDLMSSGNVVGLSLRAGWMAGQVRFTRHITQPKSETMRVTRRLQVGLTPRTEVSTGWQQALMAS